MPLETKQELYDQVVQTIQNWNQKQATLEQASMACRDLQVAENILVRWDVKYSEGMRQFRSFPIDRETLWKICKDKVAKEIADAEKDSIAAFNEMIEACVQLRIKYGDMDG